jgi:hypothetical protein
MATAGFSSVALLDRYATPVASLHSFSSATNESYDSWKSGLQAALTEQLLPPRATPAWPLNLTVLETTTLPGYEQQYVSYETQKGVHVPAYLLVPRSPGPHPGCVCIAGHTPSGKADVAGVGDVDHTLGVAYGKVLAERGIVCICPDNAGMGERADPDEPGCMATWRKLNMLGIDLTGFRVFDLMRAIDVLESLPHVLPNQIGLAGLSGGCWLGIVLAALDERVQAAVLSGFFTTFAQTNWVGHCVCHHPFGIGRLCEMPDIAGLIAPRHIFVEFGTEDVTRPLQPALDMTRAIYTAAGCPNAVRAHVFEGGHRFDGSKSLPWLVERLSGLRSTGEEPRL